MVAGLLAAYVSTISTHLNWGTSYLVHDVYRRFVRADADERHYVAVGRLATGALMVLAALLTYVLDTARESFELMMSIGAGTGLIYLLRWFWWRVNAWSEISAMVGSFAVAVGFFVARRGGLQDGWSHIALIATVAITSVVWIAATFLTAPTERETLVRFYERVRPAGPGWARGPAPPPASGRARTACPQQLLAWTLGCTFVYASLFATGSFLYGRTTSGLVLAAVAVVTGLALWRLVAAIFSAPARGSTEA
jgi:uncharacterized sodium:solute symporter family permease YidK